MLYLKDCSKLETFIFDPMSTISTINKATEEIRDPIENIRTDAQYFLLTKRSLVQLRHLGIASCQIMEEIVTKIGSSEENTNDIFPKLKHLQLQYLPSLTRFCSGSYVEFPSLELLHLEDCSELGVFIFHSKSENVTVGKQTEETDVQYFLLDEKVGFPSLESLMIYDMPKLRTIWHCQLAPGSFRKLKSVRVSGCDSLINIFAPSMMGRLNTLYTLVTCQCKSLQVVFDVGVVLGVEEAYGTLRNQ
ncbi:unnamed protein product [Prunus armeniaca]|uniref:Disease resistance protein At4g27190-like leucine-rich repeats domain-containing protein n=1 Tax=Prunus armeniaca TaxID=36596 RepID=A0A6J5WRC0_PRUAR|nr:unnamed protein product [Prunus armeniaca]